MRKAKKITKRMRSMVKALEELRLKRLNLQAKLTETMNREYAISASLRAECEDAGLGWVGVIEVVNMGG